MMQAATNTGSSSSSFEAGATDAAVVPSAMASASGSDDHGHGDENAIFSNNQDAGDAIASSTRDDDNALARGGDAPMQAGVEDALEDIEEESPDFMLEITMG
jgi:hypothetical protein